MTSIATGSSPHATSTKSTSAAPASYGATGSTDSVSPQAAAKARILTHMNKDHALSLFDYLSYFMHREFDPDNASSSVEMTDITNNYITLRYTYPDSPNAQYAQFPINPPMESLREARTALVDMAKTAAGTRGYATHRISSYVPPWSGATPVHDMALLFVVAILILPPLRTPVFSALASLLGIPADGGAFWGPIVSFCSNWPWIPAIVTYTAHFAEGLFVIRPKVTKYRVPKEERAWWYVSIFFEGFPAILRFNRLISKVEGQH
ncbi:uncharacterized protein SAPINGB_P003940 [Magnusiomyces paraingens]|uniref:DUF2470 domain-containing protein n=1 Tax=Magnusiomyces paraingens TaxID=2606893 RepID=A0A5E8BXD2_9ASCO|nr:uncharacterized protein SAPINGB_P003940 [Saprochaete ingens]VVT54167.1 unnamed protein product [Saprochaete ingens]